MYFDSLVRRRLPLVSQSVHSGDEESGQEFSPCGVIS